jgi:hypothetical protein
MKAIDEIAEDPQMRAMLLDLFTEIAILEHLTRARFTPATGDDVDARSFGILNYLVRQRKEFEKVAILAWCFQVSDDDVMDSAKLLTSRKYVEIDWQDGDRCVVLTAAGKARHEKFLAEVAPDVFEIVADFDPEHLRITTETLKELRRTFDNLPDR